MSAIVLRAFHNDPKIKKQYLSRVRAHANADEIIHGVYWESGKGCAVGCTIHSGHHSAYESELGIPIALAYLEDRIFEGMANGKSKEWPARFLSAIPVGADLSRVNAQFLLKLQERNRASLKEPEKYGLGAAIDGVIAVLKDWAVTGIVNESAARSAARSAESAESAAWSAAWSAASAASAARSAAWSAARSAESAAWSAAWSAESAASAARSAAWSAASAESAESAASAAWSAEYERQADDLVALLKVAK